MKREILFRGKRVDNKKWVQGYLFKTWNKSYILWGTINGYPNMIDIIPETVGQFTRQTDKNGVKIFEQDIVRVKWWNGYHREYQFSNYEVYYDENQMGYYLRGNEFNWEYFYGVEIIGNIHDNPELMKL